jgi:UDP-N-acetylmuramyl pentapeptide phosphotransferase/UDP-N-acetylglucosamine-1-phosphate transferase
MIAIVGAVGLAFGLASVAVLMLTRAGSRLPADRPNARSLHDRATPRGGGLAIWAGFVPVALALPPPMTAWHLWLAALAAVAAVSFADDARSVPAGIRFVVHLVAAMLVAATIAPLRDAPATLVLCTILIVWGANLFNFMDGSDGLAALMALTGFAALAVAAGHVGADALATICAALAAATLPFFLVNRPPATMFMGDVGSVPLGFLAAAIGVAGVALGVWPAWLPALAFLPFLADATVTLLRRALRGEKLWRPHRSHYYQRLHAAGAGHLGTLAIFGAAMGACAVAAVACLLLAPAHGYAVLGLAFALHLIGFVAIDYHCGSSNVRTP